MADKPEPSEPFPVDAGVYPNDSSYGNERAGTRKLMSLAGELDRRKMLNEIERKSSDAEYQSERKARGFAKGGMVKKHGSSTSVAGLCRDTKTIKC
jgi:hypothetical protein